MVCVPWLRDEVEQVAVPVEAVHDTLHPIGLPLSVKLTAPMRPTALEDGVTVAVKVTDWLTEDGLVLEASVVVLAAEDTVCVRLVLVMVL